MPRIAHLITDLNGFGGTEATLLRYLQGSRVPLANQRVFVLRQVGSGDTLGAQMLRLGVQVMELNQRKGLITPKALRQLRRALVDFAPDVISAWLYHPCLLAAMLLPLLNDQPTAVWHIRSLPFASPWRHPGRWAVQRALAIVAKFTSPVLISNSTAAVHAHAAIGLGSDFSRWHIVPNGVDLERFRPDPADRKAMRHELSLPDDAVVVVCIGRFAPEKAYPICFAALASALGRLEPGLSERVYIVAAGNGVGEDNPSFAALALGSTVPSKRMRLLGKRPDVQRLLRAGDLFVLSSISESFPNALIEAMAVSVPCVATDLGGVLELLGDNRFVARAGDVDSLANALMLGLSLSPQGREAIGRANRERIARDHGLAEMVRRFDELFESSASSTPMRN